jgi:hypothetical protein
MPACFPSRKGLNRLVHEKFQCRANTRKGEIVALDQRSVAFDVVIRTYEPEDACRRTRCRPPRRTIQGRPAALDREIRAIDVAPLKFQ